MVNALWWIVKLEWHAQVLDFVPSAWFFSQAMKDAIITQTVRWDSDFMLVFVFKHEYVRYINMS